jgi:parallel beta-helix repeat protein
LEKRRLFAVLTVNSIADNDTRDSVLTLREAINLVNGTDPVAGLTQAETAQINFSQSAVGINDTINFNIPGSGGQVIQLTSELPSIEKPVTINGFSQPGSSAATSKSPATVLIDLDGATNRVYSGMTIDSTHVTVRGLSLTNFNGAIYFLANSGNDTIAGNWIGIEGASAFALAYAPNGTGIFLNSSSGNIIGGTTPADRNVISGNKGLGIDLRSGAANNVIEGNYIGVDPTGTSGIANTTGIEIDNGAVNNLIGGTSSGARNVISNNNGDGIYVNGANVAGTTIEGNYIGTDATGTAALGNGANGVAISGGDLDSRDVIGGATAGARNVISGNHGSGIFLDNGAYAYISGNYIGLSADGRSAIGNDSDGIYVYQSVAEIGGSINGEGNVISGNGFANPDVHKDGIEIQYPSAGMFIQRNRVGTNAAGTAVIGNKGNGIYLESGKITYIGDGNGDGNIVSGNGEDGISVHDSNYTTIQGDLIGVLADGKTAAGNKFNGVSLDGATTKSFVGGAGKGGTDIIANNRGDGVEVAGGPGGTPLMNGIRQNSIYNNGSLGIDLDYIYFKSVDVGVNPNDAGDGDTGANDYQNFPVLTAASYSSSAITIAGALNSLANTAFNIDLYASAKADSTGYGEGQQYIGTVAVTTNSSGNVGFNSTFKVAIGSNVYISGTASTSRGYAETSEFGKTIKAIANLTAVPLATPTSLAGKAVAGPAVTLLWKDNASGETGYEIQASTSSSFTTVAEDVNLATPNLSTYKVTGFKVKTYYYFRVRAVSTKTPALDSTWSSSVKFETLSA